MFLIHPSITENEILMMTDVIISVLKQTQL